MTAVIITPLPAESGGTSFHDQLAHLDYAESGHTGFAPTVHGHDASQISTGTLDPNRLGLNPSPDKVLRGDGSWVKTEHDHIQEPAAITWVVTHDLGRIPTLIGIRDSLGESWEVEPIHLSINQFTLTFPGAMTGSVHVE